MGGGVILFVLGVLSSMVAAAVFPPIAEVGSAALVRLFGWLPIQGHTNLSGEWSSSWRVVSKRFPPEVTDEHTIIRQFGNRVFVQFRNLQMPFIARGVIEGGRYVTGTWSDRTQGGYHGAFQLIIDPKTRNLSGIWVGFSMTGVVKRGSWVWIRKTRS